MPVKILQMHGCANGRKRSFVHTTTKQDECRTEAMGTEPDT
jgi:hypothetical protein